MSFVWKILKPGLIYANIGIPMGSNIKYETDHEQVSYSVSHYIKI